MDGLIHVENLNQFGANSESEYPLQKNGISPNKMNEKKMTKMSFTVAHDGDYCKKLLEHTTQHGKMGAVYFVSRLKGCPSPLSILTLRNDQE